MEIYTFLSLLKFITLAGPLNFLCGTGKVQLLDDSQLLDPDQWCRFPLSLIGIDPLSHNSMPPGTYQLT